MLGVIVARACCFAAARIMQSDEADAARIVTSAHKIHSLS